MQKYQIIEKKSYKKLHLVVDHNHIIQNSDLTDSRTQDQSVVKNLIQPIESNIRHFTSDGVYDNNPTYKLIAENWRGDNCTEFTIFKS